MDYLQASDIVIKLHDIARLIEQDIGSGAISANVRQCADNLSEVVSRRVSELYAEQISGPTH